MVSDCLSKPGLQIAAAIILPNLGGMAGGVITKRNIKSWFEGLKHPSFRPPNYAFAPVWTALYSGMGYASYVIYKQGKNLLILLDVQNKNGPCFVFRRRWILWTSKNPFDSVWQSTRTELGMDSHLFPLP